MSGGEPSSIKRDDMCREGAGSERMLAESVLWCLFGLYAGLCFRTSYKWGLRPHTLSYFLYGQKVTKKPHRGGTLSMGSLPYEPHPLDDTKGGASPPLETPA